jgi:dCMP deaminase
MNIRFFDLAKKVSKLSNHTRHQLGAVIVRGSKVVSVGINNIKTHPKSPHPYKSLHCEMSAILLAKQDLTGCEIYVYREVKTGAPAMSRPCVYCMPFIQDTGITQIHYTVNSGYKTESI